METGDGCRVIGEYPLGLWLWGGDLGLNACRGENVNGKGHPSFNEASNLQSQVVQQWDKINFVRKAARGCSEW